MNVDFERVSVCVGLHTSTVQCENIKENGTHHATIWTISIIMEKFRVSVEVSRASHSLKGMLIELREETPARMHADPPAHPLKVTAPSGPVLRHCTVW